MRFFAKNGVPLHQPSETAPSSKRRMPFARRFVSVDGEKTLFVEEREMAPPSNDCVVETPATVTCSEDAASPFRSLLECGDDLDQVEPETISGVFPTTTRTASAVTPPQKENCPWSYKNAIKTALLLDDEPETTATTSAPLQEQNCTSSWNYTRAIKTALLLDDEDDSLIMINGDDSKLPPRQVKHEALDDDVDYDLQFRLNKSDTDLVEGESPGTIRLTEEGLKRHERKTLSESDLYRSKKPKGVAAFKREKTERLRQREFMQLQSMELYSQEQAAVKKTLATTEKKSLFGRFKSDKNKHKSTTTTEPKSTVHVLNVEKDLDYKEQVRIQKMRQKEIERQRKREAEAKRILPSKILTVDETGLANEAGIEVMNEPMLSSKNNNNNNNNNKKRGSSMERKNATTTEPPEKLSTSVQDSPCVVCSLRERTYIAVPCMHFCLCEPCAKILRKKNVDCPVCATPHTTFNQVFA